MGDDLKHNGGNNSALKRQADGTEALSSYLDEGEDYVRRDQDEVRHDVEAEAGPRDLASETSTTE